MSLCGNILSFVLILICEVTDMYRSSAYITVTFALTENIFFYITSRDCIIDGLLTRGLPLKLCLHSMGVSEDCNNMSR